MAKSRTTKAAIIRSLGSANLPVYIVSDHHKIAYCNAATCAWLGQDEEFLTSLTCRYHCGVDQPPSHKIASGLCPPPDAFAGAVVSGYVHRFAEESAEFREAMFYPLCAANQTSGSVLVIVHGPATPRPQIANSDRQPQLAELHAEIARIQLETTSLLNLDLVVGTSDDSRRVRRQIDLAATTGANALICGPTGSGRRQIAELIHYAQGPQSVGPLIPIEGSLCDAEVVQETIKDLYRLRKDHPDEPLGRLLLLDVDRMSPAAQMEVVGFLKLPDFQLPLMATTSGDGPPRIDQRIFREVAVITIEIPSLRKRRADIAMLAQAAVEEFNLSQDRQLSGFSQAATELLTDYHWPGEMSELQEVVQFACRAAKDPVIRSEDLPQHLRIAGRIGRTEPIAKSTIELDAFLAEIECELIGRAISFSGGNKSRAAKLLGISRARLLRRLAANDVPLQEDDARGDRTPPDIRISGDIDPDDRGGTDG